MNKRKQMIEEKANKLKTERATQRMSSILIRLEELEQRVAELEK